MCLPCWADKQSWSRQLQPLLQPPACSLVGSQWLKMAGSKRELNAAWQGESPVLTEALYQMNARAGSSAPAPFSGRSLS